MGDLSRLTTKPSVLARHGMPACIRTLNDNDNIDFGAMTFVHAQEAAEQKLMDAVSVIVHAEPPPYGDDGSPITDLSEVYPTEIFEAMALKAQSDMRFARHLAIAIRNGTVPAHAWPTRAIVLPESIGLLRIARRIILLAVDRFLVTRSPDLGYEFDARGFANDRPTDDETTVRDMMDWPLIHGLCHVSMPDGVETKIVEMRSPSWLRIARAMPRGDGTRRITGLRPLPTLDATPWFEVATAA